MSTDTQGIKPRGIFAWMRRRLVSPVLRLLYEGATPSKLAWSIALGIIVGINPVPGTTTVLSLVVAHALGLKRSAAQLGTHAVYPFQLLLIFPLIRAGSVMFHASALPLTRSQLLTLARTHPLLLIRQLWTWEWHALVVWAIASVVLLPFFAMLLKRWFARILRARTQARPA